MKTQRLIIVGLAIVVAYLLLRLSCTPAAKPDTHYDTLKIHDTVFMDKWQTIEISKPKPVLVIKTDTVLRIDSATCQEMANKMLAQYFYSDTIRQDTADIYYNAVVQNNELQAIRAGFRLNIPITTTQTIINPVRERNRFYLGTSAGYAEHAGLMLGFSAYFKTKGHMMYTASVDLDRNFRPLYRVGFAVALK